MSIPGRYRLSNARVVVVAHSGRVSIPGRYRLSNPRVVVVAAVVVDRYFRAHIHLRLKYALLGTHVIYLDCLGQGRGS